MDKEQPSVSVVVPIYNVENYLDDCLRSVCGQTLQNIEIICVDDGSKDNSLQLAKSFAKKDSRIKVLTKPNAGYGHTMNLGFDNATGEYIAIIESDDFADKTMLKTLYDVAKKNELDVVKSDYYTFSTDGSKIKDLKYVNTCNDHKEYNKVFSSADKNIFHFQMNTWTGIYRTEFIRANNIRHNETPGAAYQDNGFWFQTLSLAKSIMFVNKAFYYYRQDNPNSSINSKSKVFCMCDEYDFIKKFLDSHPEKAKDLMMEFYKKRFHNYFYTYKRIAEEHRLSFLERFARDLRLSKQNKEIDFAKLDPWMLQMTNRLIDDYELFYYEDTIYSLEQKLKEKCEFFEKLQQSEEIKKGTAIKGIVRKLIKKAK